MIEFKSDTQALGFIDIKVKSSKKLSLINKYNKKNILEISQSRERYFLKICKHIKNFGGAMLAIDYGYYKETLNFTLQSINNNKKSNVLDNIGLQDITALVDFKRLIEIAEIEGLTVNIFSTQRDFLIKYGIYKRFQKICSSSSKNEQMNLESGLNRIINKDDMGLLFKLLVVSK